MAGWRECAGAGILVHLFWEMVGTLPRLCRTPPPEGNKKTAKVAVFMYIAQKLIRGGENFLDIIVVV